MWRTSYKLLILLLLTACWESNETRVQRFLLKGNEAYKKNQNEQAIHYYREALQIDSTNADALNNIGSVYFRSALYDQALPYYQRALAKKRTPSFLLHYANTLFALKKYDSVLTLCAEIQKLKPDTLPALLLRASASMQSRKFDDAKNVFHRIHQLDKQNNEAQRYYAECFYFLKKYDSAWLLNERVLPSDSSGSAWNLKGLMLTREKKFSEALDAFNHALEQSEEAFYYNNRGYVFLQLNQLDKAKADIEKSLILNADNAWAHHYYGLYWMKMKNYTEAEKHLLRSLAIEKTDNIEQDLYQLYTQFHQPTKAALYKPTL